MMPMTRLLPMDDDPPSFEYTAGVDSSTCRNPYDTSPNVSLPASLAAALHVDSVRDGAFICVTALAT